VFFYTVVVALTIIDRIAKGVYTICSIVQKGHGDISGLFKQCMCIKGAGRERDT